MERPLIMEQRKRLSNQQRTYLETTISKLKQLDMGSTTIENVLKTDGYTREQGEWLNKNKQRIQQLLEIQKL